MKNKVLEELESKVMEILPSEERRKKGPYALFECFQSIPCNPCYTSCKFNAVKPLTNITETPETYYDKCVGCGVCITVCPGLAAFVVDETFSETESLVKIPYEYTPLPERGEVVEGVNRIGEPVCKVRIEGVTTFKNKTSVVAIAVPKEMTHVVRGIQMVPREELISEVAEDVEIGDSIVCRCEDVTEEEIKSMLDEGLDSLKQVKLHSRVSMGPCQGKTCIALVLRELSIKTKKPINDLMAPKYRQPIKPIKIASFLNEKEQ